MLSNKVSEILTTKLTKAPITASIFEVMQTMVAEDVGRVIITDDDVPVGIFTEKDILRRVINADLDTRKTEIKRVMTSPIRAVREETHIIDAFTKMYRGKYRHLLVRGRRGKMIGIVSMRRILNIAVELGQGLSETRTMTDITLGNVVSVDAATTLHDAIELMNKRNIGAVIVTSAETPAGIFTERDVLKRVATKDANIKTTPVSHAMTAPLITMARTTLVGDVLAEMYRRDIRNMPISGDRGEITGIVSMPEILQYARAFNIDEQVRRSWREVAEFLDTEDQYTPG